MPKSKKPLLSSVNAYWLAAGIVALLIVCGGAYVLLRDPSKTNTIETIPVSTSSSNNSLSESDTTNTDNTSASQPAPEKSSASAGSQASMNGTLLAPYGSFVSNHKPGQNGSNMVELSQCTTSAGATCYIKFAQVGTAKTLPVKTADSNGFISWEWNVNDAGLTSGKWTIEAVAQLGDQTKSTTDQLSLEIQ